MALLKNNLILLIGRIKKRPSVFGRRDSNRSCIRVRLTCIKVLSSSLFVKVTLFYLSIIPICCFINSNSDVEIPNAYFVILRIFVKKLIMNCLQFCL